MSACASDLETAELVPIDQNVSQIVLQNELQKFVTRRSDCPAILLMVIHNQAMGMSGVPELPIVVGIASAAVLNTLHIVVVVNHLVKKGGCHFLNGAGEGSCSDVDFVSTANLGNPGVLSQGEVTVGFWRGLDGDGGS